MFYKWVLLTSVAKGGKFRAYGMNSFCITNLPLASTRWIRSTIELFHALSKHTQSRALLSINLYSIKKFEFLLKNHGNAENQTPGWLGEKPCAMLTTIRHRKTFSLLCGWLVAKKCKIAIYFFLMSQKKTETGTFGRPEENSYAVFCAFGFFLRFESSEKSHVTTKMWFCSFCQIFSCG